MDMPVPYLYKRLARKLVPRRALILKTFLVSAFVCAASVLYVLHPFKIIEMEPGLLLLIVMSGVFVSGGIATVSFTLLSIDFCFRETRSIAELRQSTSFWARVGGLLVGFSEWIACWFLFCLLIMCGALATGIAFVLVPTYWRVIF